MSEKLCIYGEVLYDHFPDGQQVLGGAPFNVAWHLKAFAQAPYFISRVGNDPEGIEIRKTMLDWGMDTRGLQSDDQLPTGKVSIELVNDEPEYEIVHPCAYDAIAADSLDLDECDFLYHGSLALRDTTSHDSLQNILQQRPGTIFVDINLRPPWWNRQSVDNLVTGADWLKFNFDELDLLYAAAGSPRERLARLLEEKDLQGIILTRGQRGALLVTRDNEIHEVEPAENIAITDTVGAGDAFTSVIITGLLNGWPLEQCLQRAQAFASAIVGRRGATVNDMNFYQPFINDWQLS